MRPVNRGRVGLRVKAEALTLDLDLVLLVVVVEVFQKVVGLGAVSAVVASCARFARGGFALGLDFMTA